MAVEVFEAGDFKSLPLIVTRHTRNPHLLYFQKITTKQQTKERPAQKTLFIANVPPYVNEEAIAHAFRKAGNIEKVLLSDEPTTQEIEESANIFVSNSWSFKFKYAYVVFNNASSLNIALKLQKLQPLFTMNNLLKFGLNRWQADEKLIQIPEIELEKIAENYMRLYNEQRQKEIIYNKELSQADGEGWVTVTKKSKVKSFSNTETTGFKILHKEEDGKKRKELNNFYTFQIRENKKKETHSMGEIYQGGKSKSIQFKKKNKFKPY